VVYRHPHWYTESDLSKSTLIRFDLRALHNERALSCDRGRTRSGDLQYNPQQAIPCTNPRCIQGTWPLIRGCGLGFECADRDDLWWMLFGLVARADPQLAKRVAVAAVMLQLSEDDDSESWYLPSLINGELRQDMLDYITLKKR